MSEAPIESSRFRINRKVGWTIAAVATSVSTIAIVALAFAPIGIFKEEVESRIADKFGTAVHIGSLVRTDHFSLHPVVELRDLTIAQPGWAGKGDMLRVDLARVKFPILLLLRGQFKPEINCAYRDGRQTHPRCRQARKLVSRKASAGKPQRRFKFLSFQHHPKPLFDAR